MAIFEDDAPHVAGAVIALSILGYLTYALRAYTRITRGAWGLEDSFMTAATLPFTVLSIACLGASFNGVGIHAFRFEEPENEQYTTRGLFWFFLFEVFYCVTIIPIKLSISLMLVRIAQGRKAYVWSQYVVMGLFTTMNLIAAFYIIFQCSPVATAWDTSLLEKGGSCQPSQYLADIYYATTAVNITTDWFTALMPIPLLRTVQMNMNTKVTVAFILGLGILASLSACIRLKYTVNLTNSNDYLFGLANIVIWGYAENGVGLIVGNISTLRPLFRRILKLGSDSEHSHNTASRQNHPGSFHLGGKGFRPSNFQPSYELSPNGTTDDAYGSYFASTHTGGGSGRRARTAETKSSMEGSESGSQEQILYDSQRFGNQAIVVSRAVSVSRE
ncbi:hypothetical protein GQ53DRAFT_835996 [Thozetella sp. PMI_491]|nr:hypothetical protein GQ53DRAFT_835996 [Thozetella sp. PMI_491]